MRCTKCHYLSFEPEARCRNCGHDLSIDDLDRIEEPAAFDLPLDAADDNGFNLADLPLDAAALPRAVAVSVPARVTAHGPGVAVASARSPRRSRGATTVALSPEDFMPATSELPLFVQDMSESDEPEPLVRVPSRPRAPIAVRRSTADPARLRTRYASAPDERTPGEDLLPDLLDELDNAVSPEPVTTPIPAWTSEPTPERLPTGWQQPVDGGTRLAAACIDAALLGGIAIVVTWCTMRLAGLPISDLAVLPKWPMVGFFLLIVVGYLLMFTAVNGQTVGKMACGIRVVGTSLDAVINDRVTVSQAVVRAVTALPSVLALGAGFLPALVGAGLAVHDRVAHTRVVRV